MKKATLTTMVVAAAGAVYAAASWYFGKQTEAILTTQYAKVLEAVPYLKITKRDYQRGIFTANEAMTLVYFNPFPDSEESDEEDPIGFDNKPLVLQLRTRITHGPFPGLSSFAAASSQTEILLPKEIKQRFSELLGGKQLLSEQTSIFFDGSTHTSFSSPRLDLELPHPDEASEKTLSVRWQGLEGQMDISPNVKSLSLKAQAPALQLTSDDGMELRLSGIRFESKNERTFDDIALYLSGTQHLSVTRAAMTLPGDELEPVVVQQFKYDREIPVDGEFVDFIERLGAEHVQIGKDTLGPIHFDYSIRHLHARSVAMITQGFMDLYTGRSEASGEERFINHFTGLLFEQAQPLLGNAPEFHIDRISLADAHGESFLSGRVRLDGFDLEEAMANPLMLLSKLEASGELSLQEDMVLALLENPPGQAAIAARNESTPAAIKARSAAAVAQFRQQVAMLTDQGYLTREGNQLRSTAVFKRGQLLVNGKPFMPGQASGGQEDPVME